MLFGQGALGPVGVVAESIVVFVVILFSRLRLVVYTIENILRR